MNLCFFGSYEKNYQRNNIIRKGLNQIGVKVFECNVPYALGLRFWKRHARLVTKYKALNAEYDYLFVAEMNHKNMPLAYIISKKYKKSVIFDPFISMYDSNVIDRKRVKANSFAALRCFLWDKLSLNLADFILTDTQQHLCYFRDKFGIPDARMRVLYLGSDDTIFGPDLGKTESNNDLTVFFYGTFVPLHGIEYIVKAASLLKKEDIYFKILGDGQTYQEIQYLVNKLQPINIRFIPPVPLKELPAHINRSDICLGVFGNTPKTQRVIPTKVFNCMAVGKPVITADTPAIREIFTDRENIFLCKCANEESLAEAIMKLKEDQELRKNIAENGYRLIKERFTPRAIGQRLVEILEEFSREN
jgi:glycosyltransferase involved in cell wall biosynthesis